MEEIEEKEKKGEERKTSVVKKRFLGPDRFVGCAMGHSC
jgi:hypothetical protein